MDQKTRLIRALKGERTDRRPFICPGGMMTMTVTEVMEMEGVFWPEAHVDPVKMALLAIAANRRSGVENTGAPFCMTVEAEAMGSTVDLGSKHIEPRITAYAMKSVEDFDALSSIDLAAGRARACVEAMSILKQNAPDTPVIANLSGPVSVASSLVDAIPYYKSLLNNKKAAHRLNAFVVENLKAFGDAMLQAGADIVCIADPSASGDILSRKSFEEFSLPYLNELSDHFRSGFGAPSIVHICGDVRNFGDALSQISAEAISVDTIVGITKLKEMAKGKVTMGNVSTYLLEKGEPGDVMKSGARCLSKGVDILAPACGISPRTPVANILSLSLAAAKDYE